MKTLLLAALMVMGTMAAPTLTTPSAAATGTVLVCDNTEDTPYTGTYSRVTVPAGASCYLKDAVVQGNFKALHGAGDVYIIDTRVDRNIHIKGAQDTVKIGNAGCKLDPIAGNNINVSRSHNVAICEMSVKNNIMVRRNDGRISLFRNRVGRNIEVTNNLRFHHEPGDGQHPRIAAIRLRHNVAGRHIVVKRNPDRGLILVDNTPTPTT